MVKGNASQTRRRHEMPKLNDLISFHNFSLVCTEIKREGMPIFAIIRINEDDSCVILRTFMDLRFALTALDQETRAHTAPNPESIVVHPNEFEV